jgi:uncharacterized protein YdhG (YjbR/CyaY superfamily)
MAKADSAANRSAVKSVNDYIAEFPPDTRKVLKELRALIKGTVPGVIERLSYGIINFELNGRYLVYIGGWKKHIGLYPVTGVVATAFEKELKSYKSGKGTIQFPLDKPMPKDLIRRIVKLRVRELTREK